MSEKAACDGCGKVRVVKEIDSGAKICAACMKEIRPPRSKELAPYVTIDAYARKGINLPADITREQVEAMRQEVELLRYYVMNVWYSVVGRGINYTEGYDQDYDHLERVCYELWATPAGKRLVRVEAERQAIGQRVYEETKAANKRKRHTGENGPGYYVEDGVLYDRQTDRDLAYWDFKPELVKDADYLTVAEVLRREYPQCVPKPGLLGRIFGR